MPLENSFLNLGNDCCRYDYDFKKLYHEYNYINTVNYTKMQMPIIFCQV